MEILLNLIEADKVFRLFHMSMMFDSYLGQFLKACYAKVPDESIGATRELADENIFQLHRFLEVARD
jgi:hypothetical protein